MRCFRFPDKFCADSRPYWVLFAGFVVAIALLTYTLYNRQPERYRRLSQVFSGVSSKPDIQVVAFQPQDGNAAVSVPNAGNANTMGSAQAGVKANWFGGGPPPVPRRTYQFLGMSVSDVSEGQARRQVFEAARSGVVITAIDPNGLAAVSGLMKGDAIVSMNRTSTPTVADFERVAGAVSFAKGILLDVSRSGRRHYMTIDTQNVLR